jgi:hypothetical protein
VYQIHHWRTELGSYEHEHDRDVETGNHLWSIYRTKREYAREMGLPLRSVIEAPSKLAAEEAAARLGFGEPWSH